MTFLKQCFNFYINSSIHVAFSVFAMTWITLISYSLDYNEAVLYFVFYATITGYNFVKYFGIAKFHHRGLANWLKTIQIFSLLAFIAMMYYVTQLEAKTVLITLGLGVVTFLYAIPLLPISYFRDHKQNLRQISGLKVYVIGLVWAFTTVIVPLVDNAVTINFDVLITVLQRFVFVIVLMLPFEIRDLNYDSLKLGTIPQRIGLKNTKICGVVLLVIFCLLEYFKDTVVSAVLISNAVIGLLTLLFVVFSKKEQSKYYSAFWVESIPILWLFVLLMLR